MSELTDFRDGPPARLTREEIEATELKDEIRRRDEIIESNKTLAVELLEADTINAALKIQLTAALKRVKELEAGLMPFAAEADWMNLSSVKPDVLNWPIEGSSLTYRDILLAAKLLKEKPE